MCGHYTTCVVFTTHLLYVQIVLENPHRCGKSHICVGKSTYIWIYPHMCGNSLTCLVFIKYLGHVEIGWEQQQICELCHRLWFLIHWASVWCLVELWQPDKMEGVITPIRYRSNRQTLEKFKLFPACISQEDIKKETKDIFGVIKSKKKQFIKT